MQFYKINICQIMIFWLSTVYNKDKIIKNCQLNHRKVASIIVSAQIICLPSVVKTTLQKIHVSMETVHLILK